MPINTTTQTTKDRNYAERRLKRLRQKPLNKQTDTRFIALMLEALLDYADSLEERISELEENEE